LRIVADFCRHCPASVPQEITFEDRKNGEPSLDKFEKHPEKGVIVGMAKLLPPFAALGIVLGALVGFHIGGLGGAVLFGFLGTVIAGLLAAIFGALLGEAIAEMPDVLHALGGIAVIALIFALYGVGVK